MEPKALIEKILKDRSVLVAGGVALFVVVVTSAYMLLSGPTVVGKSSDVGSVAQTWLKEVLRAQGVNAEVNVLGIKDLGSVYSVTLSAKVGATINVIELLVSKDGRYIFVQGIDALSGNQLGGIVDIRYDIPKSGRPKVELFVMSYCPYGVQMEKAILPVVELLGDKIDFQLKFVNYTLRGIKEFNENLRQYCIQQEYGKDKLVEYLKCFTASGNSEECAESVGIDAGTINTCMNRLYDEYNLDTYIEQAGGSNTIRFPIFDADNLRYGVTGSPTLVINGVRVDNVERSPEALKNIICSAFTNPPAECSTVLSSQVASPGFGLSARASPATSAAACGAN